MVKTKHVKDRRSLAFRSLDDILADAEAMMSRQPIRTTGNWTAGQIIEHVGLFICWSIDGFPFTMPFPLRFIGPLIKGRAQRKPLQSGIKAPGRMTPHMPGQGVALEDAMRTLRGEIGRVKAGKRMEKPSPLFGKLSHEEWVRIHCRHAEMHFSFMHPSS